MTVKSTQQHKQQIIWRQSAGVSNWTLRRASSKTAALLPRQTPPVDVVEDTEVLHHQASRQAEVGQHLEAKAGTNPISFNNNNSHSTKPQRQQMTTTTAPWKVRLRCKP